MSLGLEGRVIVVTGGASGIGRATAELCAQRAAHVVVADVAVDHGTELAADLSSRGHSAMFVECDVSNESAVHELMDRTTRAFGRLDVLIACAGILEGAAIGVEDLDVETFDRVLDINARGSFLCAKHAIRAMGPSGDGGVLFLHASKLCYRNVRAKPVSGKRGPLCGINKRTLTIVEGKRSTPTTQPKQERETHRARPSIQGKAEGAAAQSTAPHP